jgi:hypothetical protein
MLSVAQICVLNLHAVPNGHPNSILQLRVQGLSHPRGALCALIFLRIGPPFRAVSV